MFEPNFTRHDVQAAAAPGALAHGRRLAADVVDLDWDEYSLWGGLSAENLKVGDLMVHHVSRPLAGECPCPDGRADELCVHMVALAYAFLGEDGELAHRLATLSRDAVVALVVDLADSSTWARQAIWTRLASRDLDQADDDQPPRQTVSRDR